MLKSIIGVLTFFIILFFYLHICFHLKTSDDLEVYEVEQYSKEKMEEVCDIRQPVVFNNSHELNGLAAATSLAVLTSEHSLFEVNVRRGALDGGVNDCVNDGVNDGGPSSDGELYTPMSLQTCEQIINAKPGYFSESNAEFLKESGCTRHIQFNDGELRPAFVSNCYYDVIFGSNGTTTPLRYALNYRNFFMVTHGQVTVKLSPPKSEKYLYATNDYENFEFISPINPWSPQEKYTVDFSKTKCVDIQLSPGKILFIPSKWWYSIRFDEKSSITNFSYRTYMNNIAMSPSLFMCTLQNQNIQRRFLHVKTNENSNARDMSSVTAEAPGLSDEPAITGTCTATPTPDTVIEQPIASNDAAPYHAEVGEV